MRVKTTYTGTLGSDRHVVVLPGQRWFPDVEEFLRALRDQHGVDALVLTCLDERPGDDLEIDYLLEPRPSTATTPGLSWSQPGWYDVALSWVTEELERVGQPLNGVPTQVRTWDLSAVYRCPTASGAVYFKASAHQSTVRPNRENAEEFLFAHEPRVLRELSNDRPGDFPQPLAIDEARVWMLLPDLGPLLESSADVEVWAAALQDHARLQLAYADKHERLFEAGCVDRRLARLDAEVDRLLGANGLTEHLSTEDHQAIQARAGHIREVIAELAAIGIPETLLHSDLHPRNIAVQQGRAVAFDWTDAALGHPFLDLATFFEDRSPISGDPVLAKRLKRVYLDEWAGYASAEELERALGLATELAVVHQAQTCLHMLDYITGPSRLAIARGGSRWLLGLIGRTG